MNSNMFLEELKLHGYASISSPELVPTARILCIDSCQNLTRFLIPNGTERLYIGFCENLEIPLSVVCRTQMTSLFINECKKLKRLPEHDEEIVGGEDEEASSDQDKVFIFALKHSKRNLVQR
ncbi:hypothetical protein P3S67_014108 [Capsicum chacoense]